MKALQKNKTWIVILFLELLSLSPIFMVLGNVVPPFPLKAHYLSFGLAFLLVCLMLIQLKSKKWLVYIALFYFVLQFFLSGLHPKDFVDFFFGPFVFISLMDILINERLSKKELLKYQKRFFILMWVPLIFSFLQYLELLPLTFWNATYVNLSQVGGEKIPRPNGFLYHGSELSIVLFFVAAKQLFKSSKKFIFNLLFLILIAYGTYYKALTATIILLFIYYFTVLNPINSFQWTVKIFKNEKRLYYTIFTFVCIGFLIISYQLLVVGKKEIFDPQFLTGRGSIWNVYLQALKDFSAFQWLFGAGIGAEAELFRQNATASLFFPLKADPNSSLTPDAHHAILSPLLNIGLVGLSFYYLLFKILHSQIKNFASSSNFNKKIYFIVVVLPIFTLGITIPIFKNAIYWVSIGFISHYWIISQNKKHHDKEQQTH